MHLHCRQTKQMRFVFPVFMAFLYLFVYFFIGHPKVGYVFSWDLVDGWTWLLSHI